MKHETPLNPTEHIASLYDARFTPPFFNEEEATRYASRIDPERDLLSVKNKILRLAAELVLQNIKQDGNAVDLGCGEGQWSRFVANHGMHSLGVDSNPFNIEIAKKRNDDYKSKYLCSSIENIPEIYNNSFDLAMASYLLNYITKLSEAFQACYRLLKPGSRLIIITKIFHQINEELEKIKGSFLPVISNGKFTVYTSSNPNHIHRKT